MIFEGSNRLKLFLFKHRKRTKDFKFIAEIKINQLT